MKNVVSKSVYVIRVLMAVFTCFFGITIFFINSNLLCTLLARGLNLHVDPKFTGGVVAADFFDDTDDCSAQDFNLVRYTVHKPVYDAKWQATADYWQMDFEFKEGTEKAAEKERNINIYFGFNNDAEEKLQNQFEYVATVQGTEGKVEDCKGNFICNFEASILNNGKTVKLRIPLKNKNLQKVYVANKTVHYVEICDGKEIKDFLGTKETAVIAEMDIKKENSLEEENIFKETVYAKLSENEPKQDSQEAEKSGAYYGYNDLEEALKFFEEKINVNPESALDLCHYGACLAMKGGQSSPFAAVGFVNNAYVYLDKAVEVAKNNEELAETLMNRAGVSKSVPEAVFNKSLVGAEDFAKLAVMQKAEVKTAKEENLNTLEYEKYLLAYYYINASECYKNAGKESESILMLQEAKKAVEYNK